MVILEIDFSIRYPHREPIENDIIYAIRRQIAILFENSEFGLVQERDNDRFENTFATPLNDTYNTPYNDLFVYYRFDYPLVNGNLAFLLQEIPLFVERMQNEYNLVVFARIAFITPPQLPQD